MKSKKKSYLSIKVGLRLPKCNLSHTTSLRDKSLTGFTLLEILVVIMIMGFLTAMVAGHFLGIKEDAGNVTALNEMNKIKEAVRDRFYPDLGLIPEDAVHPEMAIRFLCLKDDGVGPPVGPERQEMYVFIENILGAAQANRLIDWDKYSRKGWRGPYMEQETSYEADPGPPPKYFPIIVTPWVDFCEGRARAVESLDPALAAEYRKGKYYQILGGQNRNNARIICYGANGLNGGAETATVAELKDPNFDIGDDLVMFVFGAGATRSP